MTVPEAALLSRQETSRPIDDDASSASPLSELSTPLTDIPPNGERLYASFDPPETRVKVEGGSHTHHAELLPSNLTSAIETAQSGAASDLPTATDGSNSKKRKRRSSPPWTFPVAENTTLKSADGRRMSARVHTGETPAQSENEDTRGRSSSMSLARSRPVSPPWKRFEAEGPTSVVVDGKRKSGRVNKEVTNTPKRVSPRTKKLNDAAAASQKSARHAVVQPKRESSVMDAAKSKPVGHRRKSSHAENRIAELQAQIDALQPKGVHHTPTKASGQKRKRGGSPVASMDIIQTPPDARRHHGQRTQSPEVPRSAPKLKLRFNAVRHAVPPPHPNAQPPSPKRPPELSLFHRIERLELQELQQPYTENERGPPDMAWFIQRAEKQAADEGLMRRKLLEEARPGGKLSKDKLSLFHDVDQQAEPPKQFGHNDHLVAHILHLRHLQAREKTHHRNLAKKVAHEALEFWKAKRGPTEEDIREQEDRMFRLIYKQVVFDMRAKWDMVAAYVQQQRLQQWETEEELKRQRRLQEKLEWSESMVARQRGEANSDSEMVEDSTGDVDGSDSSSEDESEGNMSDSASDDEAGEDHVDGGGEMDAKELEAYLKQRDAESDDGHESDKVDQDEEGTSLAALLGPGDDTTEKDGLAVNSTGRAGDSEDNADEEFHPATVKAEHSDDETERSASAMLRSRRTSPSPTGSQKDASDDTSDESIDMDSDDYDSDEDMSSTGDEADVEGDDYDDGTAGNDHDSDDGQAKGGSLLGFYSKNEIKTFGLPTPTTSAEGDERDGNADRVPEEIPKGTDVEMTADPEPEVDLNDAPDVLSAAEPQPSSTPGTPTSEEDDSAATKSLVPSPALLRGTLRSYQHAGLDWLASLYRNGTNGILADEMGLGKTIQTIALLAHLAEEHEVWETHLVIVPTSVILNWVTEFQKFLPGFRVLGYYGSAEERAAKRRGWVNDPHHEQRDRRGYNAIVTSYNVAMQDINALRNVQWHYLVLDEAHNIRNFNSQRWQVLIRLKTRARLLLTGTPLQNSLTELWSLLTFLTAGDDDPAHGDLEEFLSHWKEPVKEIFDRGVQTLSNEAQKVVDQLHVSLRPFLLRRLKTEVEKDLPKKTESVVVCKLSKRQRQLYQEYMGLAETRRSLTHGNAVSAGRVLLSLRRVCNHPDLFDPRPIQTSFAMEKSPLEGFHIKEQIVRRLLGVREDTPRGMLVTANEHRRRYSVSRSKALSATGLLQKEVKEAEAGLADVDQESATVSGCQALLKLRQRQKALERLRSCVTAGEHHYTPVYGCDLREMVTVHNNKLYKAIKSVRPVVRAFRAWPSFGRLPLMFGHTDHRADWLLSQTTALQESLQTHQRYAERLQDSIVKFAFCTPVVTAPVLNFAIPQDVQQQLRSSSAYPLEPDYAHESRIRMSIAFPDSRLLIYDSGKLQRLTRLLRELQSKGSRSLIFTQMTGTLNILEQFLNLLNLPYLRLDGSTPVERRQLYSAEFNRPDSKYQCMILSSRAGGVGLNLVGASSVIFYDLDWNPQMDRQCMDRAHRIGQVRDVEVYKMVSEKTVEENILRRATQKSFLDQTVIQEGHFTTEYQQPSRQRSHADDDESEADDNDVAAAIDRFLGTGSNEKATTHALESVEDREDVQAAQRARKEEQHQDDADFADRPSAKATAATSSIPPTPGMTPGPGGEDGDDDDEHSWRGAHVDTYMIRHMQRLFQDLPFIPPARPKTRLDRKGRDRDRRARRKR